MSCVASINPQRYSVKPAHHKKDKYPFEDGEVVVLGPETFVSRDGSVINWRGENYVRQTPVKNPDPYEDYK